MNLTPSGLGDDSHVYKIYYLWDTYISFLHCKMKSLGTLAVTELSITESLSSKTEKKFNVGFILPTPMQEIPQ